MSLRTHTYVTVPPGHWRGPPQPADPDGWLSLQIIRTGDPEDGWVPVEGWRSGGEDGTDVAPADGVSVAADLIPRQ